MSIIHHIRKCIFRNNSKHDFNICQSKISIKYNNPFSGLTEFCGKIDGNIRLTNPTLAACDGNNPGNINEILISKLYNISKLFGLIHQILPPNNCFTIFWVSNISISSGTFCPSVAYDIFAPEYSFIFRRFPYDEVSSSFVKISLYSAILP